MKEQIKNFLGLAASLDPEQQNALLRAVGVKSPRRVRGRASKIKRRVDMAREGLNLLSNAARKEDYPIDCFVYFTTDDENNAIGIVTDFTQDEEGDFVWVVSHASTDEIFDCYADGMTKIPQHLVDAAMNKADENQGDDDPDVIDVEFEER